MFEANTRRIGLPRLRPTQIRDIVFRKSKWKLVPSGDLARKNRKLIVIEKKKLIERFNNYSYILFYTYVLLIKIEYFIF